MSRILVKATITAISGLGIMLLGGCEPGHKQTSQNGYRGAGLNQIVDARHVVPAAVIPPEAYALPPDGGPLAGQSYQNLKVLGGISKDRFDHLMANINQWVAPPAAGCTYCHNPANMASDEKYTKVVARQMLLMTQTINSQWSPHVKQTGVTCYTCHRGNAVPVNKWANAVGAPNPDSITGNRYGQNAPNADVGYASLPSNGFAEYLNGAKNIRLAADTALPSKDHVVSVKDAEKTYGLMVHLSTALGVNCTYCHNTQSFRAWNLSRPQRATAWYGIRMVRDINQHHIGILQSVFPDYRKGPLGDPYKVNCTTCHQGQAKPLGGVSMIAQAPALKGPTPAAPTVVAVPAAPSAPLALNDAPALLARK